MEKLLTLLLDVWREVGRHIDIDSMLRSLAPQLGRALPLDRLILHRLHPASRTIESRTITCGEAPSEVSVTRQPFPVEPYERFLEWSLRAELRTYTGQSLPAKTALPAIDADDTDDAPSRTVYAGPLETNGERIGAAVFICRPDAPDDDRYPRVFESMLEALAAALDNDQRLRELQHLRDALEADRRSLLSRLGREDISESIVGSESGLSHVLDRVTLVAPSDVPVLLLGETGTGKEVVAREIHKRSSRAAGPFLRVNCGAISPELIDSELFGHERGSFTGAVDSHRGWFERADGGTLLLDEVGELPPAAQVRLLRILQDGTFNRLGSEQSQTIDVRAIAATNRDLKAMIAAGEFREDLWFRLAVFPIEIPPVRERLEDIPALASHFALRAAKRLGSPPQIPTPEQIDLLTRYAWPGNVRELAAVIERAAILGNGKTLEIRAALGVQPEAGFPAPPSVASQRDATDHDKAPLMTLEKAIIAHISEALTRTGGQVEGPRGAARLLDINPNTLRSRMRKLGLNPSDFHPPLPM